MAESAVSKKGSPGGAAGKATTWKNKIMNPTRKQGIALVGSRFSATFHGESVRKKERNAQSR
jgi:hypothetical protein